ncbi:hypothetical protein [Liquorilactobacillus nagelii]|uniref:hypothetical protein n=1 Tax=Liquorilactobacillus nagelii TaxID=82688 RepID=UPI0039ECB27D
MEIKINLPDFPSWKTFAISFKSIVEVVALAAIIVALIAFLAMSSPADFGVAAATAVTELFVSLAKDFT